MPSPAVPATFEAPPSSIGAGSDAAAVPAHKRPALLGRLATVSRARKVLGLMVLVGAWEANSRLSDNRLTPTVSAILESLRDQATSGDLWFHGRLTLFRGFLGLAIALVAGTGIGFLMARSRWVDAALQPLLAGAYPIPKISLYPVVILILGLGGASKVWQVAIECFFPIAYTAYAGARGIDREMVWLARNSGAGWLRTTKDVTLPAALPSVLTGLRVAAPIMLVVITLTELIGESRGLGFMISDAQANFQPANALSVVVVLGVLGFILDRLIVLLTRRLVFWEQGVQL